MQHNSKIILYDFLNDDGDYKDPEKDFDGATTTTNP